MSSLCRRLSVVTLSAPFLFFGYNTAAAEECRNPDVLRFSMVPTEEISQEVDQYAPLIEYLKEKTSKEFEFFLPTSYASVLEGMLGGFVDMGMLGPDSYVIGKEQDPSITAFATYTNRKGHFQGEAWSGYKAVLLVNSNSEFKTVEDLKGSVLALVDPASTSGNLIPRVSFRDVINTDLESYFSRVVYTGAHDQSAVAIKDGKVDAGFLATLALDYTIDRGVVSEDDFRLIWSSDVIPNVPYVIKSTICQDVIETITQAFLDLHDDERGQTFLASINAGKFVPVQDTDYDVIRALRALDK